jgi:hypothetical protein
MESLARLDRGLDELDGWIASGDGFLAHRVAAVSAWSIAEQVDHSLKVLGTVFRLIARDEESPGRLRMAGRLALGLGWFPRGVGKSPRSVLPVVAPARELAAAVGLRRAELAALAGEPARLASRRRIYRHPYFGVLTAAEAVRFAAVHTEHHAKIVRDVIHRLS